MAEPIIKKKLPLSVLCVEDEDLPREMLTKLLARHVEEVYSAPNGEAGLTLFKEKRPDIVISDVNMPYMDGLRMSKAIKEISSHTPIIIMSAHNTLEHLHSALDVGVDKYLIKPMNSPVLRAALEQVANSLLQEQEKKALEMKLVDELRAKAELEEAKAKELARLKESFMVIFTHELKTPLNVILNLTKHSLHSLHEQLYSDPDILEMLRTVLYSAEEMNETVMNLLDVARLKNGRFSIHTGDIILENLIYEELDKIRFMNPDSTIKFEFTPESKTVINTDLYLMRRILSNLLTNTLKYAKSYVKIHVTYNNDKTFNLIVEDDGKGISEDKKEKIFELFEQCEAGENVYTRVGMGTGIGLYFCRLALDQLSCKIFVGDSSLGGAQFIIKGFYCE